MTEIKENSKSSEWRWVPTKDNPADDGTRYASDALNNDSRWFTGPEFLKLNESEWPKNQFVNAIGIERVFAIEGKEALPGPVINRPENLIDFTRFSTLTRLLNTVMQVLKAINLMRNFVTDSIDLKFSAEIICLKISQNISFSNEINALKNNKPISNRSRILKFNPKLDKNGIYAT